MKDDVLKYHGRRSIRLKDYDYSSAGAYFITICVADKAFLLENEQVREIIENQWLALPERFETITLDAFVIMPNHVHGIIIIDMFAANRAIEIDRANRAYTLGEIIRMFKSKTAIESNRVVNRKGIPFWQSNYYEHIVRNDDDLSIIAIIK